jgi:hypothetical protein
LPTKTKLKDVSTIENIERSVDEKLDEKAADFHPPKVADIAVIGSLELNRDYSPIEKSVDRVIKVKG